MYLGHVSLSDFRNYADLELPLTAGVTVLVGANGQGKTNLVEAVNYVATLGSHRAGSDVPLVRLGSDRAVVRASVIRDGRATLVEIEITPGRANRARINRAPVPRPREVLGVLRTVLFAPEDLALVKGDPSDRRRYLDDLLVTRAPRYAGVRSDYERVLKQRNALLKSAGAAARSGRLDLSTLDVWDAQLAATGAQLLAARLDLVEALRPLVDKTYAALAGAGASPTDLEYRSSVNIAADTVGTAEDAGEFGEATGRRASADRARLAQALQSSLAEVRREELDRGVTLVGPHRDDLVLKLGPHPARGYASHGESWSFALALRLGAYALLRAEGDEPVLVLDDVFAELDVERRQRLAELVRGGEQVLVTAADPTDVPDRLAGARVEVRAGAAVPLPEPDR